MSLIKPMVSSKSNEWATPKKLFDRLNEEFNFTLDPCSTHENAKCKNNYTIEDDGLSKEWEGNVVFINPPYGGHTGEWLEKCKHEAHEHHCVCVCLIVSSTDRSYWHNIINIYAQEIRFMRGRVKFGDSKSTAPFASAIVDYREHHQ